MLPCDLTGVLGEGRVGVAERTLSWTVGEAIRLPSEGVGTLGEARALFRVGVPPRVLVGVPVLGGVPTLSDLAVGPCLLRECLIGSALGGVVLLWRSLVFVETTVSFRPLGRVRSETWLSSFADAVFLMASFFAAVAVCVLLWKLAVVSPGVVPRDLYRWTLVRLEAERDRTK